MLPVLKLLTLSVIKKKTAPNINEHLNIYPSTKIFSYSSSGEVDYNHQLNIEENVLLW